MKKIIITFLLFLPLFFYTFSQNNYEYYQRALGLRGTALQDTLHEIIKGHERVSYYDLRYSLAQTDTLPNGEIWDIYTDTCHWRANEAHALPLASGAAHECDCMQREHSFCQSWMGSVYYDIVDEPFYSDMFQLYPTDGYINQLHNDNPYGMVAEDGADRTFANGSRLGLNTYPGAPSVTAYEPIDEYKGDIARSFFYMATRYKYEDQTFMQESPMTYQSQPKEWVLEMLLAWHHLDPVSQKELDRNEAIYRNWQRNRNPFIDYPELADLIWREGDRVFTMEEDTIIRPRIADFELLNATTISVVFDSAMTISSMTNPNYYLLPGTTMDSITVDTVNAVRLHLHTALNFGHTFFLTIRNVQAVGGTFMRDTVLSITTGSPAFLGWTFDVISSGDYYEEESIAADYGAIASTNRIFFNGSYGSDAWQSTWLQGNTISGTTVGDPRTNAIAGKALSFKNHAANGKTFVVRFSTRWYKNITLRFACAATPTGFNDITCKWNAVNPTNPSYDHLIDRFYIDTLKETFRTHLYPMEDEWDMTDAIYVKFTLNGATHQTGNIKFDNICIHGEKCTDESTRRDTAVAGTTYSNYGFNISIPYTYAGDYVFTRRLVRENACDSVVTLLLYVIESVGIDDDKETEEATYTVFPNPASESVSVSGNAMKEVAVYNMMGQVCSKATSVNDSSITLSLKGLPAGVYVVRILTDGGRMVTKKLVVKQK